VKVFRYKKHGCFLALDSAGLIQLAFSRYSRGVVHSIGDALSRCADRDLIARTEDARIAEMLKRRFGFVGGAMSGSEYVLMREKVNVL